MKAVKFWEYGDVDVLEVVEVPVPTPGSGEVLVRVFAAGINPGESAVRRGEHRKLFRSNLPEGQGSDFAGIVESVGAKVTNWRAGDEVIGFTVGQSHAEFVVVPEGDLVAKPAGLEWEQAGSLYVAGTAAWTAVEAVGVQPGDTVVVSAAAGGVGVWACQLVQLKGGTVIGTASDDSFDFLRTIRVKPVEYGDGLADRIRSRAPAGVDAYLDNHGHGNVETAIELGVAPHRINTLADPRAAKKYGVKAQGGKAEGTESGSSAEVLATLAHLLASKSVIIPLSAVFTLDEVRDAFRELEKGHTRGKIVLGMNPIPHRNPSHKGSHRVG